jgi:uncharacterized protein (TIRG00374 family)
MKKSLRRWAWLAVGGVVLGLIVYNLSRSPEWRDFRWDRLWASITHARPGLLLLSVGMVYATYFMRALRWKYFLDPIQKASLGVLLAAQFLGFSSIYLIGRPGELVRPAYISKKENIPFSAMMAVWLLERIFDGVFMVLLFSTALFFMPLGADSARGATLLVAVHEGAYGLLAFSALVVAFLVLFRLQTETLTRWLIRALGFLPGAWHRHLEHFLHSFSSGLTVIQNWKDFLASVATTVVLWAFNTTIFWWVLKSLRGSLDQITWLMGAVVLFCASLGLVIQFPGIGGGVQVGAILALTELFHVGVEEATGAAILVWVVIFVPCLLAGIVLLVREGLSFRKLEALAEEERAATVETL